MSSLDENREDCRNAELSLIAAVKNMSNLGSFKWDRYPPLVDSILDTDASDDIWTALRSRSGLHTLDVVDASDVSDTMRPIHESQVIFCSSTSGIFLTKARTRFFQYRILATFLIALGVTTAWECPSQWSA